MLQHQYPARSNQRASNRAKVFPRPAWVDPPRLACVWPVLKQSFVMQAYAKLRAELVAAHPQLRGRSPAGAVLITGIIKNKMQNARKRARNVATGKSQFVHAIHSLLDALRSPNTECRLSIRMKHAPCPTDASQPFLRCSKPLSQVLRCSSITRMPVALQAGPLCYTPGHGSQVGGARHGRRHRLSPVAIRQTETVHMHVTKGNLLHLHQAMPQ